MIYSPEFKTKIINGFGQDGQTWLETLPERLEEALQKWQLTFIGPVQNLSYNYVAKALDKKGEPVILKMGLPGFDFNNEIQAVNSYNGDGCAKLIQSDAGLGAMLLEQLLPGTMLSDIEDEEEVIQHFTEVWKAIRRPLPQDHSMPKITDWADGLHRYLEEHGNGDGPIDEKYIKLAQTFFSEISATTNSMEILHGDLHHENILFSNERGWLAIDPKGVAGDRYFDCTSFMINHLFDKKNPRETLKLRVDRLCRKLSLNRRRFLKASIAMSILYACWGIEDNERWTDTYQCSLWFQEFLQETREN